MNHQINRRALYSWILLVLLAGSPLHAQQGTTDTLALTGQAAPDTSGANGIFGSFNTPVLNQVGQVTFNAFSMTGTTSGTSNDEAIYLGSTLGLTQAVREGQVVPFGNGQFSASLSTVPLINDFGQLVFVDGNIQNTTNGFLDNEGIYSFTNNSLTQMQRRSTTGTEDINTPSFSNSGRVAIATRSVTASTDDTSIIVTSGSSTLFPQINEGNLVPGGNGEYGDLIFSASNPVASNAAFQVALRVSMTNTVGGGTDNTAITRSGPNVFIGREGQAVSGGGTISHMSSTSNNPVINSSGQVAFFTSLSNTPNGGFDNQAIYRGNGGFLTQIVREGQTVSGGNGKFGSLSRPNDINTLNQVVFSATITGTLGGTIDNSALYRGSGGTPTEIARENNAAPDGNGVFSNFSSTTFLNNTGQVVFRGFLRDTAGVTTDDSGIFIGDGQEVIRVAREGQALAGSTVGTVSLASAQKTGGNSPINDFGQVAFQAILVNGDQGVFLFTPELHYRRTFSSSWDSASNWTVGIKPAGLHDVVIDPAASVTVNGPGSDIAIKSLQIGGGTGIATLDLQAGSVIAPSSGSLDIRSTGVLTGDGTINAAISNAGTIAADNLTVVGNITSTGTINGSGRINATITNNAPGTIQALSGDHLHLTGASSHTNNGLVDVNGQDALATLEFNSGLTNSASGRIQARGRTALQFDGGLTNDGIVSLRFADATVSGDLTNNGAIGIAFSNITFASGDLTNPSLIAITDQSRVLFADDVIDNGGDIFVATGSTAVFFGSYNGGTSGTGDVTVLGDLAPGSSPGVSSFGGNLTLGPQAILEIEIGGTTLGSEFDMLHIADTVMLDGILDISLINGFAPAVGDSFEIITAGSVVDTFDVENLPDLGGPLWNINYGATNVVLEVVSPFSADFDHDGDVDADDLAQWQGDFGSTGNSDADADGDSDGADFLAWQQQLSSFVPSLAVSQTVPEPSALWLMLAGFVQFTCVRKSHGYNLKRTSLGPAPSHQVENNSRHILRGN